MLTGDELRVMRLQEVTEITGFSKVTIWRLEKQGKFPQRLQLGTGANGPVGWRSDEVYAWVKALQPKAAHSA